MTASTATPVYPDEHSEDKAWGQASLHPPMHPQANPNAEPGYWQQNQVQERAAGEGGMRRQQSPGPGLPQDGPNPALKTQDTSGALVEPFVLPLSSHRAEEVLLEPHDEAPATPYEENESEPPRRTVP